MRNLPLQASVEMFNINLTPENPNSLEGVWQAVGRAEERIFATGLYFYDVENVASAELMFRDPVSKRQFYSWEEKEDFCMSHNVVTNENNERSFSQVVGSVEIKSGRYICYPNYYQTKMPSFELVDPTKAGHIKCIAFYIVDPTTRLLSTRIIPPQQPNWTQESNESIDVATSTSAKHKRDDLKSAHACSNQIINNPFDVRIV
ncbi:hypothetical protein FBU31_000340 [Coemansia sp. 'formosensis']|nr:hypothetical protein FBU31_000340 [Coemansia sp. 'formosensis']